MSAAALLSLLHLCDSLFPIGSFAYSDGLEAAVNGGWITTAAELQAWLESCRDEGFGQTDGPAIALAWRALTASDWETMAGLDEEIMALRPSSTIRSSSRAMGARLLKTWQRLRPEARLAELVQLSRGGAMGPSLPLAFAAACFAAGVPLESALNGYAYTRLAATVSSAMRLVAIGQHDAHRLLSETLAGVPGLAAAVMARSAPPRSFTPALDIAQMMQPYVRSRLFRS